MKEVAYTRMVPLAKNKSITSVTLVTCPVDHRTMPLLVAFCEKNWEADLVQGGGMTPKLNTVPV